MPLLRRSLRDGLALIIRRRDGNSALTLGDQNGKPRDQALRWARFHLDDQT